MTEALAPTSERKFRKGYFKDALKRIGGVAVGLHTNVSLDKSAETRGTKLTAKIDNILAKKLQSDRSHEYAHIFEQKPELLARIRSAYKEAAFWHGSGRYQTRSDGSRVDILRGMLEQGSIQPKYDLYNPDNGSKTSISMAHSRMYSRICSEAYSPRGSELKNRFGSLHFWAGLFGVSNSVEQLRDRNHRRRLRTSGGLGEMRAHNSRRLTERGMQTKSRGPGSSIDGNFPVLFGIRENAFEAAETEQWMRKHEARSLKPISIDGLTHVEVPFDNVKETQELFAEYGHPEFPVFPIEAGEEYVSQFPVSQLASGKRLVA